MKRTLIGLSAFLALFAPGRAWSEPADPAAAPTSTAIYEEIEILRRLLNQGLETAYGLPGPASGPRVWSGSGVPVEFAHHKLSDVHHQLAGTEGVYVKGCGAVFSATLPPPSRSPLPVATPPAPASPSPWDQARAELRGEKLRTPEAGATGKQAPLAEAILRVLAENGKHFRHLPDNETITVALTFRRSAACSQCHAVVTAGTGVAPFVVARGAVHTGQPAWAAPEGGQTGSAAEATSLPKEVLVGDLHIRQKRWEEAAKAYAEALRALEEAARREKEKTGAWEVKTLLSVVEVANKLAQVYNAQGDTERAVHFLKVAGRAAGWAEEAAQGKPFPAGAVPLPARLVISTPKKILDQVGAGKMTFEEFRKAATVEYLTFPAADKAGTKTPPAGH